MSNFSVNVPINDVSFGQTSIALLREFKNLGLNPAIFPIGNINLSSQKIDQEFGDWVNSCLIKAQSTHSRKTPTFKLWHIDGSLESYSEKQVLLSFYELDQPTEMELNIVKNNSKVIFTSKYTSGIFEDYGATNIEYCPLGFDKYNFKRIEKKFFNDERIVFLCCGKFEHRKRTEKTIRSWVKKYGNSREYFLQCAIYNPFISPEENESIVRNILEGRNYFNVQFIGYMQQNELYNQFLNSGNIIIGMGTEGFGLPEFHATALGKHSVILNAAGYKSWATPENSTLIQPSSKIPAYDNRFFFQGRPTNQGNVFDFSEESFINGCEQAISRVRKNSVNTEGLKLQEEFSYAKSAAKIVEIINSI